MAIDVEAYLHDHIPITGHMGIRVVRAGIDEVVLAAPLEPNINHRSTVFGGSCASLAMLAAWSLVLLRVGERRTELRIVIQHGDMDYLLPVDAAFTATTGPVDEAAWRRFVRTVERRRPARIELAVSVGCGGRIVATFRGMYAAIPIPPEGDGAAISATSEASEAR